MPRTVEGIVEAHQAATSRRAAGRPVWELTVRLGDVWKNEELTFLERRAAVVARLRATRWAGLNPNIEEIFDNLADAEDAEEFDGWWDELYDEADRDRVWIDLRP